MISCIGGARDPKSWTLFQVANIDNGEISISQVYINKIEKEKFSEKIFIIKNVQLFKALIRDILS